MGIRKEEVISRKFLVFTLALPARRLKLQDFYQWSWSGLHCRLDNNNYG